MFRTCFQTGDSDKTQDKLFTQNRDYVIIAEIKTATKRFLKIHFEFAKSHNGLLNSHVTFLPYSPGIDSTSSLIHNCSSSVNIPVFKPRRRKDPTLGGDTYQNGSYIGVPPGSNI